MSASFQEIRKMNECLIRAVNYTKSILQELGSASIKDSDNMQFAAPLQSMLKKDIDATITNLNTFEKDLADSVSSYIESAKIPAFVAANQGWTNRCIDCYISNLERARESLNKKIGSQLFMPSLDDELELAKKMKDKYYKK